MNLTIRQSTDLENIQLLDNYLFPGEELEPEEMEKFKWWTATTADGAIAGYAAVWLLEDQSTAFLCRAGVAPLARGQGLQKRLIRCRVNHARRKGYRWAISYTMTNNYGSCNSLIREGFTLYEPRYLYAGPDVLYWRRRLLQDSSSSDE